MWTNLLGDLFAWVSIGIAYVPSSSSSSIAFVLSPFANRKFKKESFQNKGLLKKSHHY
jgi:hypothetical protein